MRKINCKLSFKKDLSNIELMGIERILDCIDEASEIEELTGVRSEDYGLAYTSSNGYGMYNVTENITIEYHDEYNWINIGYFAITVNGMLIAVCYDANDNEYLYEIESSDY